MVILMSDEEYDIQNIDSNPFDESDMRHDNWNLRNTPYREQILSVAKTEGLKHDTKRSRKNSCICKEKRN